MKYESEFENIEDVILDYPSILWSKYITQENVSNYKFGRIIDPIIDLLKKNISEGNKKFEIYACGNNMFLEALEYECETFRDLDIKIYSDAFFESGI